MELDDILQEKLEEISSRFIPPDSLLWEVEEKIWSYSPEEGKAFSSPEASFTCPRNHQTLLLYSLLDQFR